MKTSVKRVVRFDVCFSKKIYLLKKNLEVKNFFFCFSFLLSNFLIRASFYGRLFKYTPQVIITHTEASDKNELPNLAEAILVSQGQTNETPLFKIHNNSRKKLSHLKQPRLYSYKNDKFLINQ